MKNNSEEAKYKLLQYNYRSFFDCRRVPTILFIYDIDDIGFYGNVFVPNDAIKQEIAMNQFCALNWAWF